MHRSSSCSASPATTLLMTAVALVFTCGIFSTRALAQDSAVDPEVPAAAVHSKKKAPRKPAQPPPAAVAPAPVVTPPPPPAAAAAVPPKPPQNVIVSQKLIEAGASCTGRVEAIARESLAGTKTLLPVSGFSRADPTKHMVSVVVGQSFGADAKVPHGLTGILAAPGPAGSRCDGYRFQVMPSPLACKDIEADLLKGGSVVADLAGFPLLQTAGGQIALMPTAGANGCVVVSFHTDY